jgi:two-component system response regulator NreC
MIHLLIVDDQPAVRKGLRMRLDAESDLCVVGEASDGQMAVELAKSVHPHIILLDVEMPQMDGICTANALHLSCPDISVIILSIHDDTLTRERAMNAGCAAFITKSMPDDVLLTTIRQVALS